MWGVLGFLIGWVVVVVGEADFVGKELVDVRVFLVRDKLVFCNFFVVVFIYEVYCWIYILFRIIYFSGL